jgi:hypothetical protein
MFGLKIAIFRIHSLNDTFDIVYLMPIGNILKESSLCILLCDTMQHRVKKVPVVVMKCEEGTRA